MAEVNMDALRPLVLQHAGEEMLYRYQHLVDSKDLRGLAELVADDVTIQRVGGPLRRGREEFVSFYRHFVESDVDRAHHTASNVLTRELAVRADGLTEIRIDACFVAITTHRSGEARMMWGRYTDDALETPDGWRLTAKRIDLIRTAFIEESALAPLDMVSFAPRAGSRAGDTTTQEDRSADD